MEPEVRKFPRLDTCDPEIKQQGKDVAEAKTQISDHATEIANLKSDIDEKQRTIANLERKLKRV